MQLHSLVFAALVLVGCSGDSTPSETPRGVGEPREPIAAPPAPPPVKARFGRVPPQPPSRDPLDPRQDRPRLNAERPQAPPTEEQPATPDQPPAEPAAAQRDLSNELRSALGGAASCIQGMTEQRVVANVSVTFSVVGRATRAEVSVPGASETAVACVRSQALGVHLPGPVPGAPRTVTTSLEFAQNH